MTTLSTVGIIGLGTMGAGMARNLSKQYRVIAYNRTRSKADALASEGIKAAHAIRELGAAELIFTCVSDDEAVRSIYEELIPSVAAGTTIVDCSTISVELAEQLSSACSQAGIKFLDAPITGSKLGAENGKLVFMAGGDAAVFDSVVPAFSAMGQVHVHCGPAGYGQRAKLALNLAQALILESYLESLVFAVKNGVPLEAMERIMESSGARSGVGTFKLGSIKQRDFSAHFKWSLMHKDLKLAERERRKLGLSLPLADRIVEIFERSKDRPDEDFSTIAKALEESSSVTLTP